MPTTDPKTNCHRVLWGYGRLTHILINGVSLAEARKQARAWARQNRCRTRVEGYDLHCPAGTDPWFVISDFNNE